MSGWTLGSMQDGTPTVWDGINRLVAVLAKTEPGHDTRLGSPSTPEGQAANARLIAAAPDLLAALVEMLANADDAEDTKNGEGEEYADITAARAAIAKATGIADVCRLACAECKRPICTGAKALREGVGA